MKLTRRLLALTLTLALGLGLLPSEALALLRRGEDKPTSFTVSSGETVETDETWESVYPYGAFVFKQSELALAEGGDTAVVEVLRLGGDAGRATLQIAFSPTVFLLDQEGNRSYGSAAGYGDIAVQVEDPLPIARYQPLGKDPDPEPAGLALGQRPYTGEEAQEGDVDLWVDVQADSFQWYVLDGGKWHKIDDAVEDHLPVGAEDLEKYDFRCVFTQGGTAYSTHSSQGAAYVKPDAEVLPQMPDDLDLDPEPTFSELVMDPEDPCAPILFELTFADGERVKELRFTAPEDREAEAAQFCTFTILDHQGGELYRDGDTLIVSVADNDDPLPSTLGFAVTQVTQDKAQGFAQLTVERTGGSQSVVTVKYATTDGTAKAGRDYEAQSGTLAFYTEMDKQIIQIPLIDDQTADDKGLTFTVTLSDVRGDNNCTLSGDTAAVTLVNSGEGKGNTLATLMALPASAEDQMEDATGRATVGEALDFAKAETAQGQEVVLTQDQLLRADYTLDGQANTYQYGRLHFDTGTYRTGSYWSSEASVAGMSSLDFTNWTGDTYQDGTGRKVQSDRNKSGSLTIPNMNQLFSRFRGRAQWKPELSGSWRLFWYGMNFAYPYFNASGDQIGRGYTRCEKDGTTYTLYYYPEQSISKDLNINSSDNTLTLGIAEYDGEPSYDDAWGRLADGWLVRRTFANDLNLVIHTANDGQNDGPGNVPTAPQGAAALDASSRIYDYMKPDVTVASGSGGVDRNGKLYVGSKLIISLGATDSYFPYSGEALNAAVYLTRRDGSILTGPKITGDGKNYTVTLLWDGITQSDIEDTYSINVVMTRKQDLVLDLSPSVQRLTDREGRPTAQIDPSKVKEAADLFWQNGASTITLGYSQVTPNAPHFSTNVVERLITAQSMAGQENDPRKSLGSVENLQYINFNRSAQDRIVYNGKLYKGNEKIYLSVNDLSASRLNFLYYNEAYLSAESIMTTSIGSVGLYWDGNGNGRIDGHFDTATGYFVLDKDSSGQELDTFFMFLEEGESLNQALVAPTQDEQGNWHEYFLKIYYNMVPRCLITPPGKEGDKAQVLPAFLPSVTDDQASGALTEAQKSYRYLYSGKDGQGSYTSDNHPMYGAEATALQFVDVALGGDRSPAHEEDGEMVWTPDHRGSLLFPFARPEPILLDNTVAGESFSLTDFSVDDSGTVSVSEAGKRELNGYLGSFLGDTTVALCVQQQTRTTGDLPGHAHEVNPESTSLIRRSSLPDGSHMIVGSSDPDKMPGGVSIAEMERNPYPEFGYQGGANTNPANFTFPPIASFVSFVVDGDSLKASISIPIVSWNNVTGRTVGPSMSAYQSKLDQFRAVDNLMKNIENDPAAAHQTLGDLLKNKENPRDKLNTAGSLTSHTLSFDLVLVGVMAWKYDPATNHYFFQNLSLGVLASGSYRLLHRFTAFPLVYFYFKVGLSLTTSFNWTWTRTTDDSKSPLIPKGSSIILEPGDTYEFETPYVNATLDFSGKLYVEMLDKSPQKSGKLQPTYNKGYLSSSGGERKIRFASSKGITLPQGKKGYVRLVALERTQINGLDLITESVHNYYFAGMQISPKLNIEAGFGIGLEVLKFELFLKFSASIAWVFAGYNEKTKERPDAAIKQAELLLGLGMRLVALIFTFEIDIVDAVWTYKPDTGWEFTPKYCASKSNSESGLHMGLVEDTSASQRLMSPATLLRQEVNAYLAGPDVDPAVAQDLTARFALQSAPHFNADWVNAYDTSAPFQVSGYNSDVSAFTLGDGFPINSAYKVASAGSDNYLLYTLSRAGNVNQADRSMLVLSRLVQTGDAPGLVNPADPESSIPYLVVDNDAAGDLDFDFTVENDHLIRVVWTGLASPAGSLAGLSAQDALAQIAAQRVVKTASLDLNSPGDGFSAPQTLSSQGLVYLPQTAGENAALFVEGQPYAPADREKLISLYTAALKTQGLDPEGSDQVLADTGKLRLAAQTALWDTTGQQSRLTAVIGDKAIQSVLPQGQTVDSMDMARIGDAWYLTFLTTETIPTDSQGNRVDDPDQVKNLLTIRRLCLKKLWLAGETLTFGKTYILEQIYDFDQNDSLRDGLLWGGQRQETDEPSLADLKFLRADLGDSLKGAVKNGQESFLLYEKSGYTWLIREDSLLSAAQGGSWTATPFFRTKAGEEDQAELPARTNVTIGADGAGGLAAVYLSTVPHTTNNALYLSVYDKITGTWGDGVLLAMNHMDVYERAVSQGWTQDKTEAAYYDQSLGGGMDRFTFSAPKIALGTKAKERPTGEEASQSSQEEGDHGTTLLVLTQGLLEPLEKVTTQKGDLYVPTQGSTRGIYAISYGAGQQSVGEGTLTLLNYNFSAGANLRGTAGFTNTGDVGIRGSQDQPITVRLTAQGESSQVLREWTLTENLAPGQKVSLDFDFTLGDTLTAGTRLGLSVAESDYYKDHGGSPFAATLSNLLTVAQKPELGYEDFSVRLSPQTPAGTALLDLDLRPSNRGTADVQNAYLQFTYDTGRRTEDGAIVYAPLDLTGHSLTVGEEEPLQLTGADLSQGVLPLGKLSQGYSRRVWGQLTAPLSAFRDPDTGALHLRVELFSDADTQVSADSLGRITAVHGEYDSLNNVSEQSIRQTTFFSLPGKLTVPMGYTLRLPVSYTTTHPTNHQVLVSEYPDRELDSPSNTITSRFKLMNQRFSQLYYEESVHQNGLGQGAVVLTPMEQGQTFLRIMDLNTNSYTDLPCEITEGNDGLNIFQDTGIFTFLNADGTPFGPGDPGAQSWVMSSQVESWGLDSSAPYRNDLAKGKPGASFSYSSTASSMKLIFNGDISVSSTFPGFQTVYLTAKGGLGRDGGQSAVVTFGNNSAGMPHTVTVTVRSAPSGSAYAELDRLIEYGYGDSPRTYASDTSPQMYWSHSFPQPGTCTHQTVSQTLTVMGDEDLSQLWVGPSDNWTAGAVRRLENNLWQLPLTIRGNGQLTIHTVDRAGNVSVASVNVDWWPQDQDGHTIQAGDYTAATNGWLQTSLNNNILTVNTGSADQTSLRVERMDNSGLPVLLRSQGSGNRFAVEKGLYRVTVSQTLTTSDDPSQSCRIVRADGSVEEYTAGDTVLWTSRFLRVDAPTAAQEDSDSDSSSDGGSSSSGGLIAVTVSERQARDAATVQAPVTITAAPGAPETLPTVSVSMSPVNADSGDLPLVSIPIANPDSATVAWVKVNGSWELVRDAYVENGALLVPVSGNCEIAVGQAEKTFPDVSPDAWYADSVRFVSARGLFNGTGLGFEPDGTMTRSMAAQVLYNLDRQKTPGQDLPFFDLVSDAWYTDAVRWASGRGILTGYGGAFRPEDPVTRQELVTILYRYALSAGYAPQGGQDLSAWPDAADVAPWSADAMAWAVGKGIVSGTGDGLLDPTGTATRAQVAKLLTEFVKRVR